MITLEYVRALVWPVVIVTLSLFFRSELRGIMRRLHKVSAAGAEVELFEKATENVASSLDAVQAEIERTATTSIGGQRSEIAFDELASSAARSLRTRSDAEGEAEVLLSRWRHPSRQLVSIEIARRYAERPDVDESVLNKTYRKGAPSGRIADSWRDFTLLVSDIATVLNTTGAAMPGAQLSAFGAISGSQSWRSMADAVETLSGLATHAYIYPESVTDEDATLFVATLQVTASTLLSLFQLVVLGSVRSAEIWDEASTRRGSTDERVGDGPLSVEGSGAT